MKFERILYDYQWCTIKIDTEFIHILFRNNETSALFEAKNRGKPVGGAYSLQFHKKHSQKDKDHIHAYEKNKQLFALNIDGTAHDRSHKVRIPNKLAKGIRNHFPYIILPNDNVIEWASMELQDCAQKYLLFE